LRRTFPAAHRCVQCNSVHRANSGRGLPEYAGRRARERAETLTKQLTDYREGVLQQLTSDAGMLLQPEEPLNVPDGANLFDIEEAIKRYIRGLSMRDSPPLCARGRSSAGPRGDMVTSRPDIVELLQAESPRWVQVQPAPAGFHRHRAAPNPSRRAERL